MECFLCLLGEDASHEYLISTKTQQKALLPGVLFVESGLPEIAHCVVGLRKIMFTVPMYGSHNFSCPPSIASISENPVYKIELFGT